MCVFFCAASAAGLLGSKDLCGDERGDVLVLPELHLSVHLTPDTHVTMHDLAAVVAARTWDSVALPDAASEDAGQYEAAAGVQQRHQRTPAVLTGGFTLHARKTEQSTAAGAHVDAAVAEPGFPGRGGLGGGGGGGHQLNGLTLDGHFFFLGSW